MTGPDRRVMVGIAGAPAAGKSTLAARIVDALQPDAVLVPMDGFHLTDDELRRLGLHARKGAPETFDAWGYVALLRRLRAVDEPVVYAPEFNRHLEMAEAGAIPVPATTPVVVTEGNYLLLDAAPWTSIRNILDEVWFLEVDDDTRVERLVRRHVAFGREQAVAEARAADGVDRENADAIVAGRRLADLIITLPMRPSGDAEDGPPP